MTSASFFAKTSHILFGAHEAMRAQRPDLLAGLELAKDAEADFASVCVLEDGLQCRAGEGDGQPYPLRDVLALCTRIALPLCLFVRECADEKALFACLAARDELPLLLASRDRDFLARARECVPDIVTGYIGGEEDSCQIGSAGALDVSLLPKAVASGCRLCSMKGRGIFTCVIGNCSMPEVVRMSLDGADAFLLDDPGEFAFLRKRKPQG